MENFFHFHNDGPELVSTDYWQSEHAAAGFAFLSINAGCFRLLVPSDSPDLSLPDMRSAKMAIITRAPWTEQGRPDALEILFEDNSRNPYCIFIVPEQVERMPLESDRDRVDQPPRWKFAVYTEAGKQFELPVRYRLANGEGIDMGKRNLNKLMRTNYPGGNELLDLLELVSHMRQRPQNTEEFKKLTTIEDRLQLIRTAIVDDIHKKGIDHTSKGIDHISPE